MTYKLYLFFIANTKKTDLVFRSMFVLIGLTAAFVYTSETDYTVFVKLVSTQ